MEWAKNKAEKNLGAKGQLLRETFKEQQATKDQKHALNLVLSAYKEADRIKADDQK